VSWIVLDICGTVRDDYTYWTSKNAAGGARALLGVGLLIFSGEEGNGREVLGGRYILMIHTKSVNC
jgi:hypothetical protein